MPSLLTARRGTDMLLWIVSVVIAVTIVGIYVMVRDYIWTGKPEADEYNRYHDEADRRYREQGK